MRKAVRVFSVLVLIVATLLAVSGRASAQSWSQQTNPTAETLRAIHFQTDTRGWVAGYNGAIFTTNNGGTLWTPQTSGTSLRLLAIRFVDADNGWANAGLKVIRTIDGGANWGNVTIDPSALIFRNYIFPVSPTQAWVPALCGSCMPAQRWFYRYTIGGDGSVSEQSFDVLQSSAQFLRLYFIDADNGWAVGTSGLIRRIASASSGAPAFSSQTSNTSQQLNGIFMLDANNGWIAGNGGTILNTVDGGANWVPQTSNTGTNLRDIGFSDALHGIAVGESGVALSTTNGGLTWTPENSTVSTTLWSVAVRSLAHAVGGDPVNSANSAILVRTPPPDAIFLDSFE